MESRISPFPTPICEIVDHYQQLNFDIRELKNEDRLNLVLVPIGPTAAEAEIDLSSIHLKPASGVLEEEIIQIDKLAFIELFKRATKMSSGTIPYVTGLKIYFGLKGNKIFPIFQPVFMERKSISADIYTYETRFEMHYVYDFVSKSFTEAKRADFDNIYNYRSTIQIKPTTAGNFGSLSNGDSEGVIFPFQTILSLSYYNPNDNVVFIYNAMRNENNRMKHCALLVTKGRISFTQNLQDKYANRSHLCPPCNLVAYEVFSAGPTRC
jgi:hypothetical protein